MTRVIKIGPPSFQNRGRECITSVLFASDRTQKKKGLCKEACSQNRRSSAGEVPVKKSG